jgi:protein-S-isoprenylcysteine O-methyltransferase Ste14
VEPPGEAELLTDGVYAVSRNPIYGGLLAAGAGWAVLRRRVEPVLAWWVLLAALTTKARHEEHRLAARFGPAYTDYLRRTPRFVGLPVRPSPDPSADVT